MNVRIKRMRTRGVTGKIKAYFTLILGDLEIDDLRLIDGANGLFVGFPSNKYTSKTGETKYKDIVSLTRDSDGKLTPSSIELLNQIQQAAVERYEFSKGEAVPAAGQEEKDDLPF